jgi:hypothetical protein
MRALEHRLGYTQESLGALADIAGREYSPFYVLDKIRPFQKRFKPAKKRLIDNPCDELKRLQRRINESLLRPVGLPNYLCGGVRGRRVLDNVLLHFGAPELVVLDIKRFFPSITNEHVYSVWRDLLDCSPDISGLLTRLTTFERHLPQGAPTSTSIANLVLYSVDGAIRAQCAGRGITYSSWVDDLAFSGRNVSRILEVAIPTLNRAGFSISRRKLRIMGPGDQKTLNGVLMGKRPSVVRERLSQLRSSIHKLRSGQVSEELVCSYVRALRSRIIQLKMITPTRAARLERQLESALGGR